MSKHRCFKIGPCHLFLLGATIAMLLASAGAPSPALGGEQDRSRQAVFGARVDLVQIQVQVEDSNGNFVSGLTPSDFRLRVDGSPRDVAVAYEVDLRGSREVNLEPDPTMPPAAWRQFLLFFDLSYTTPRGILEARNAAYEFVSSEIHPNDLISVATFNLVSGLQMICPFTLDRAQALDAINMMGLNRAMSINDPAGFAFRPMSSVVDSFALERGVERERGRESGAGVGVAAEVIQSAYVEAARSDFRRYREEVTGYVDQLALLGDTLRAVRGRKHVVYFSSGFSDDVLTGQSLDQFARDSELVQQNRMAEVSTEDRFGSADLRSSMDVALDALRSADAVIHVVDTLGLSPVSDVRAAASGEVSSGGRDALNYLADGTSGTVSWNRNDFSLAMREIEESTSTFYVIAYALDEDDPDVVELEVEVDRAGANVASAPSRFAPPHAYGEMNQVQQQLQLAEIISKGVEPDGFSFNVEAVPFVGENDVSRVAVVVEVPWPDLQAFAAPRGDNKTEVEILGYTLDEAGAMIDYFSRKVNLDLDRMSRMDPENGVPFRFYDMLWAIPGRYHVRVLLRDIAAGQLGTRTVPVAVPRFSAQQLLMSGPIFIDSKRPGLVMKGIDPSQPPERKESGPVAYPFVVGDRELTPYVHPSVAPGETCQFYAVTHHLAKDMFSGQVQATVLAEAVDTQGNTSPIDNVALVNQSYDAASDATMLLLEAQIPGNLPRGVYSLKFTVSDGIANAQAAGTTPFIVVSD
jgi:VWFA-related protein